MPPQVKGQTPKLWASKPMATEYFAVREYVRRIAPPVRFSDKYIEEVVDELLTAALIDVTTIHDEARNLVEDLHRDFITRVYVPLNGVRLDLPEVYIGGVRLIKMDDKAFEELIMAPYVRMLDATTPRLPDRYFEISQHREQFAGMLNGTCVEVVVAADIDIATAFADSTALDAICNFLQFASAISTPANMPCTIRVAHNGPPLLLEHVYAFSDDRLQRQRRTSRVVSDIGAYRLGDIQLEVLAQYKLDRIGNAVASVHPEEYDELLLRSVRWFAKGERDHHIDDRKLSYVTSIELFFSQPGPGATKRICEGFAFAMGGDARAARYMRDIYASRSDTSHAGVLGTFGAKELDELRWRTVQVIAAMCQLPLHTKDDVYSWVANSKASLRSDHQHALAEAIRRS